MEAWLLFLSLLSVHIVLITRIDANYIKFSDLDLDDLLVRISRDTEQRGHLNLCHAGSRDLMGQLSSAVTDFSSRLYRPAFVGKTDAVCSSYSIFQALAMAYLGARRLTAYQMKKVMRLRRLGRCTHEAVHVAMNHMLQSQSVVLKIANRVYVRDDVQVRASYIDKVHSSYDSTISPLVWNDAGDPESAINAWVSNITEGFIPSVLSPDSVSTDTAMMLVNAIYFKGTWKTSFKESDTEDQTFHQSSQEDTTVPMMHVKEHFKFASLEQEQARVLMIPYTGERFGMYIILPNNVDGLASVESVLPDILNRLDTMTSDSVRLSLPKFKVETSFDLKSTLESMGMVRPFAMMDADFSGIAGNNDLFISDVIHKAVVEVTETGTTAAAASVLGFATRTMKPKHRDFIADHPFIFVIRDNVIKMPLFIGKYSGGS